MTIKIDFDLSAFKAFAKVAPKEFEYAAKDALDRTAAKMRKGFIEVIDTKKFESLQENENYKSKYRRPMDMIKPMIRYRTRKSKGKLTSDIGIFPGKVGKRTLNNSKFKSRYGVTVARFGKVFTYGGRLRIESTKGRFQSGRKRMVKQGFHVRKNLKTIKIPKRDWYSPNKWRKPFKIIPYFKKHLDIKVAQKMKKFNTKRKGR